MYIGLDNERVTRHVPVFEDLRGVQAGPDGPGVDYTPPNLNIFLPRELSHSLPVSTTGRWIWRAVATGPFDFEIILGQETVTWSLTQREFFYFSVSERTVSAVSSPPPHCHLNMSKGLWAGWGCFWILTVVS